MLDSSWEWAISFVNRATIAAASDEELAPP